MSYRPLSVLNHIEILEGEEILRAGLIKRMQKYFGEVVGSPGLAEFYSANRDAEPSLIIVSPHSLDSNLDEFFEFCKSKVFSSKIIVFSSSYFLTRYFRHFLRSGVHGLCLWTAPDTELVDCVNKVLSNEPSIDPKISILIDQMPVDKNGAAFTGIERDVLLRLNFRDKDLAHELSKPIREIEHIVTSVLTKLGAATRTHAALHLKARGITVLPPIAARDEMTGEDLEHREAVALARRALLE